MVLNHFFFTRSASSLTSAARRRPPDTEVVVIEDGVKDQGGTAARLVAPHRIIGKHDDVALAHGNVNNCRFTGKLGAAGELTADQKLVYRSESQHDARTHFR